jgi:signal transduction histidine kinase/ActR/RegA family two-component response regulator
MTEPTTDHGLDRRLLLLAPTDRDAAIAHSILAHAGIDAAACGDPTALVAAIDEGAGAILIAEEVLAAGHGRILVDALSRQPAWSDLPVIILTAHGADSPTVLEALEMLGNVSLLERPTRVATLVSTVRSALRARARQYQLRDYLAERGRTEAALRDADRRKDEFLATLGHELRNPLAPIRTALQALRLRLGDEHETAPLCAMIERQVKNMVRLVDDLLEVSRITRGKIALRRSPVTIDDVVRGAIETTRPLMDDAGHDFSVSLPTEPLAVIGDTLRLGQVFANLLNNAAKYTPPHGTIRMTVRREGNQVLVAIRDSGIGIPPAMLASVFDMFIQVPRAAEHHYGGLGIGLTLVRDLVDMHGGRVEARSDGPGCGTEIVVRLPLAAQPRLVDAAEPPDTARCDLRRRRVLVVDDNRDAAQSLGLLVELLGADVRVVYDGPTALQAIEGYDPTVAVLDIGMPGMDGYEVARRIRQAGGSRRPTLIALTGWGQEEDRRRCRSAGFDHHLTKPIDPKAFQELLASLDEHDGRPPVDGPAPADNADTRT